MNLENRIWNLLCNSKYKEYCINAKVEQFQHLDRNINIFIAITSSGSIAAWTVWNEYSFIWGLIIAASQVVNILKPYFPFHKFIKEFNSKLVRIEYLNIEIDKLWFETKNKKIDLNEFEEKYFNLKKQLVDIENFGDEIIFKIGKKIDDKANQRMKIFLKNNYNTEIKIE
jgi:hypothetical protein